jgi:outer membrane protein assembly factor BamB
MSRHSLAALSLIACIACFKGQATIGTCNADSECQAVKPGTTCNTSVTPHICVYSCPQLCQASELCLGGQCVQVLCVPACVAGFRCNTNVKPLRCEGLTIGTVTVRDNPAPNTNGYWPRSVATTIGVDVPVDFSATTSGGVSATISVPGTAGMTPTSSSTSGTVTTFHFGIPSSVQATNSEDPVVMTVDATDNAGETAQQVPTAILKIDDVGPTISGIVANGADATVGSVPWFKQLDNSGGNTLLDIDVQVDIVDLGSGVDTATLQIVDPANPATPIDHLTPTADATVANRWHFHVARVNVMAPISTEGQFNFKVIAKDRLGHNQRADGTTVGSITVKSAGTMGIDGVKPNVTFTVTYPPTGTDCDSDTNLVCGHDASGHYWRRGLGPSGAETTALSFTATDSGSGVNTGSGTCSIVGSTNPCTPVFVTNQFNFYPNFSTATMPAVTDASFDATTGGGPVNVTVAAADKVGNLGPATTQPVNVSRLRWVQKLKLQPQGLQTLRGSPIVTTQPVPQIIVGGTSSASQDPIVALGPKGGILWHYGGTAPGAQTISPVTGNMAYDSTPASPMLYALSGNTIYAMHLTTAGVDKFCKNAVTAQAGSPVVAAGAVLVTDTGAAPRQVTPFTPANLTVAGGVCLQRTAASLGGIATIGPPTANGSTIYWGYDNTPTTAGDAGIVSATFSGTAFSSVTAHPFGAGVPPQIAGSFTFVALADAFFFGNSLNRTYHSFKTTDYTASWTTPAFTGSAVLVNPMVVGKSLALGSTTSLGKLYAFDKTAGTQKWVFPTGTGDLTNISLVATASDGKLYFTDSSTPNEMVALAPGTSAAARIWNFTGPVGAVLSGIGTEPTIDGNGILYFGQDSGNVYALITDVGAAAPAVGNDWPRTGFDNCNSSNAAFICQ